MSSKLIKNVKDKSLKLIKSNHDDLVNTWLYDKQISFILAKEEINDSDIDYLFSNTVPAGISKRQYEITKKRLYTKSFVWLCPTSGVKPDIEVQFAIYPAAVDIMQVTLIIKNFHVTLDMHEYKYCYIEAGYGTNNHLTRMGGAITNIMLERANPNGSLVVQCIDGSEGITTSIKRTTMSTLQKRALITALEYGEVKCKSIAASAADLYNRLKEDADTAGKEVAANVKKQKELDILNNGIDINITEKNFLNRVKTIGIKDYIDASKGDLGIPATASKKKIIQFSEDEPVTAPTLDVRAIKYINKGYYLTLHSLLQILSYYSSSNATLDFNLKEWYPNSWARKIWPCTILNGHYDSIMQLIGTVQTVLDNVWSESVSYLQGVSASIEAQEYTPYYNTRGEYIDTKGKHYFEWESQHLFPKLDIHLYNNTIYVTPAGSWEPPASNELKEITSKGPASLVKETPTVNNKTVGTQAEEMIAITRVKQAALSGEGVMVVAPWEPRIRPFMPVLIPLKYFSSVVRNDLIGDYIDYNKDVGVYYPHKIEVKFSTTGVNEMRVEATRTLSV